MSFGRLLISLSVSAVMLTGLVGLAQAQQALDRSILPVPDPVFPKITEMDARKAKAPPAFSVTAPEGAPNVVIVLIDDIGFGAATQFGGGINTGHVSTRGVQNALGFSC